MMDSHSIRKQQLGTFSAPAKLDKKCSSVNPLRVLVKAVVWSLDLQ
jgi:hypothetical protein